MLLSYKPLHLEAQQRLQEEGCVVDIMRQMVKPRLGLAGGFLFKVNCQGVPIITQPCKEHKIKEHNTGMTETRAARVEQNTRPKVEPSTLYQVYRCIN